MDVSKVSGYSASSSQNIMQYVQPEAQSKQTEAPDPNKSAIVAYVKSQSPATETDLVSVPHHNAYIDASSIAAARKVISERESLKQQEQRDAEALEKAKAALEDIKSHPIELKFDTSKDFNDAKVLRVVDAKSEELIRQIPSEELLRVSSMIKTYKERLAQEDMITDPQLKSKGITTNAQENENLRGVVLDDVI